jgi:hypothetical protein
VKRYIGCDAQARYSVFVSAQRAAHGNRELRDYLKALEAGTPVAVARTRRTSGPRKVWQSRAATERFRKHGFRRRSCVIYADCRGHVWQCDRTRPFSRTGFMRPSGGATHLPASRQAICLQKKNRVKLWLAIAGMPNETRIATLHEWELLDVVERHIGELEVRIRERIGRIGWVRPLKTMPGGRRCMPAAANRIAF